MIILIKLMICIGLFGWFCGMVYVTGRILGYILGCLLNSLISALGLAEKKPKKYFFPACVFVTAPVLWFYVDTHPDVLPMLVEKIYTNSLLTYLALGTAIIFNIVFVMSAMKIAGGIMRGDDSL